MLLIKRESIIYQITGGAFNDRNCVILGYDGTTTSSDDVILKDGCIEIALLDGEPNETAHVKYEYLSPLKIPGWFVGKNHGSYGYEVHLNKYGGGDNNLRTMGVVQPRAVVEGDVFATGEKVLSQPRRGCNSSVLIELEQIGWVELPPRIPIALIEDNSRVVLGKAPNRTRFYSKPLFLKKGDVLPVGDRVLDYPVMFDDVWAKLLLTGGCEGHSISLPACIPIALLPWYMIRSVATYKLWRMAKKWSYSR